MPEVESKISYKFGMHKLWAQVKCVKNAYVNELCFECIHCNLLFVLSPCINFGLLW